MLKLIFTLFFISIPAFAVDAIYTWGYGEDIKNILISIKFFTGNATYLIDTAIAIGLLLVLYKETQESNTDRIMKVAFLALIVSQLFFHSTKNYMVEDEVTNQAFAVTDVPVGIGELFSLFSMTERVLIKAFESSFSTPNSLNYSQVGLGFSMVAHLSAQKATLTHGNAYETFMNYSSDCIASGMLDGQISQDVIKSENLFHDLKVSGYETIVINNKNQREQVSCQDAYDDYLVPFFSQETNEFFQYNLIPNLEVMKKQDGLQATGEMLTGISKSGLDYVLQEMTKNMLKKGLSAMAMTTGGDTQALAYGMAKGDSLMNNQWQQSGMLAQTTLPMIKAYLTSVILAMTPLLALLSIMFGDWKYIKMIITLLVTLMLFSPLASIINYLIYLKIEDIAPLMNKGLWLPMVSSGYINEMLISYLNFLGYAAMSIPILAYALVKASEQGFVNFMSGMGGSISGTASSVASERVNGVNIGNTKVGGSTVTGANGTTTDIGGGNSTTKIAGDDNKGGYSGESVQTAKGNVIDNLGNDAGNWKANNGKLTSANMDNLNTSFTEAVTDSYNQSRATEKSSLESFSNTLSSGLSTSMAKGQIFTSSDDFSKNTGLNKSDIQTLQTAQLEALNKTFSERNSETETSNTTSGTSTALGLNASINSNDSLFGKGLKALTGFNVGANGNITVSGTSTDGQSISKELTKDESASYQKNLQESLSKTFTQDSVLALRVGQSLADNEVFSSTALKSNMDAYTKAHSIAEKYSENYSKTGSNGSNIDQKKTSQIIEHFIGNDERLSSMYNSNSIEAKRAATSEAIRRMDGAIKGENRADYNSLQTAFKEVLNQDLGSNVSNLVNTQLNQGRNLSYNVDNMVANGQNAISNTNVNNTINQNPTKNYEIKSDEFKNSAIEDINKHKEDTKLNNQSIIEKGSEILGDRNKENADDSRTGKAFVAMGSGLGDIKKGVENLIENGNKDTAYMSKDGKPLPSNDLADVKMQLDFIKDDLSEISSANTQIPEKKGGKK